MKETDSNCIHKTKFKHNCRDTILVLAAMIITGVLLAVSASAQFDQQPIEASGQGEFFSPGYTSGASSNQQPMLLSLDCDKSSPQEAGASIRWMAMAEDQENDPISFRFWLNGPSTGGVWKPVNSDLSDNTWRWDTSPQDAGNYQIKVSVSDEMHAGPQFTPVERIADFALTAPPAPQEVAAPAVAAQQQTYEPPAGEQQPAWQEPAGQPQQNEPINQKPVMISLTSDPASPQEAGAIVIWEAQAMDQESDNMQFLFLLDDQAVTNWQYQNQWTWDTSASEIGSHSIEARVRDGLHNADGDSSKKASYTVNKPNEKPSISDLSSDKASPQETGSTVTWTAQANDPENNPILFRFFLNGLVATDWQSSNQWRWTVSDGESQIDVQVRDGKHGDQDGFDDHRSAKFIGLPPNKEPVIINFGADKLSPQQTGSTITWTVEFMDADEDPLQFQFTLDGQVVQDWSDSPVWSWTATEDQVGSHVVAASVRDGKHSEGGDSAKSASFEIVLPPNNAPAMSSLSADKESPQVMGTAIAWTASASDAENNPLQFQFTLDGQVVQDWSDSPVWSWTATEDQVGSHVVAASVRDGKHSEGGDSAKSASFEIVLPPNNAPAMSSLSADKESPQVTGSVVVWTASAIDVETNPISYLFLVNGTPASDWQSENQWMWTALQPGTSVITASVKDSLHDGPQGDAGNMSSEFSIIAPAPAQEPAAVETEAVPQENITAPAAPENATPEQPVNESETVTVAPETVVPPAEENITTPIAPENLTPQQPVNETQPAESVILAVNGTPVLNSLTSDLASPQLPGTTITWTADATDADGDPLLFRFLHSGPATDGAWQPVSQWNSANTWTQTTSSADAGENQVKAQVRDGKHAGEEGFDSELSAFITISEPTFNISGRAIDDKGGPLSGWTVRLTGPDGEVSALTGEDGSYRFGNLKAGSYAVAETLPSGWKTINPESGSYSVDLSGSDAADKDFSNKLTSYSISGMKYNDLDGNGVNDGEPGMENWKIMLSGTTDGNAAVQKEATTASDGSYKFEDLLPGTYTITEVEQSGWVRTAPSQGSYSVVLTDADATDKDFGNHGSWSISGMSFSDLDGNGAKDGADPALANWNIQLARDGSIINATTTASDGSYAFRNLPPGKYTVSEVVQDGWTQTLPQGSYNIDLLDADITGKDFGNKGNLSITGKKFYDANGNGLQDEDEPGLPGQEVKLVESGKEIASVTTGQDGSYTFSNLVPGTYEVDDPIQVTVTTEVHAVVNVPAKSPNIISGMKFNDLNGNGAKDAGEPGVANWEIDLVYVVPGPATDILLAQATTDANGAYKFVNIPPGSYEIKEMARQGWAATTATVRTVHVPGMTSNQDFGNRLATPPSLGSILGLKFSDLNGNGVKDPGEPTLSGWTIELKNASTLAMISTATTGADGSYSFLNITPANYVVSEVVKSGWTQTKPPMSPGGGVYYFALAAGESKLGIDFGNRNNNLPPTNPTLASNLASPQRAGTPVIWTAGASDPEGDPLQYRFIVRGPTPSTAVRADTGYTPGKVWTWSTVGYAAGTYQIEVWIRDGNHADSSGFDVKKMVTFKLSSANLPPHINMLFSDRPAPQFVGSWIKWTALASDPEGDPLQYKFYLRGPSTNGFWMDQTGWGKNNRWIWRTNSLDVGRSEVLVAVRDGSHAGPGGSDDYEIAFFDIVSPNLPPTITSLASNLPSPQPIGATVWWKATAMDPEGNPVFYRYWLKGPTTRGFWNLVRDWSTDPTWVWPTSTADAGTSEIFVQVRDGLHSSPSGWDDDAGALFTVLRQNMPPSLVSLTADKSSSQAAGTPIKWTALASDPDKEPIFYKFWLNGPSTGGIWKVVQDWSTKNQWTWTSSGYDSGAYTVYVYARDGKHNPETGYDSAMGASYILKANPLPKLTALVPDKKSPQSAGSKVIWTATATDANKDPVLYRFWLKGPSTGEAWKIVQDWSTKNQWTWTSSGYDNGAYTVYVYARDGKHSPETGYDSALGAPYQLTANAPPQLTALVADKKSPQGAGTVVKWTATATDANKDQVLYRFWLKGPSTAEAWKVVQDWSTKNQWTWTSAPTDAGSYRVFVYARDGKHNPETSYDSLIGQDYELFSQVSNKAVSKVVVVKR